MLGEQPLQKLEPGNIAVEIDHVDWNGQIR
jgi:hypothetical protein